MTHKKLKTLAALTSALLVVNAGIGAFAPCYAEYGFVAYAAESTEVAEEEYGIRISKETDEMRSDYVFGDKLDLTGIEISGYYNTFDKNGKLIESIDFLNKDLQEMIDNGTVTLDTGDFYTNFLSGTREITINYGTASTSFYVYIENEKEACSLVIDELPTKTDYILGEELDLTGAKVSGFFTDGEQIFEFKNADLQELIDDGTITIDADDFYNYGQKSGPRSIHIGYYNAYASFSVNVIDPYEGYYMKLTSPPDKLTYNLGEELDLTGAKFYATSSLTGIMGDIFPSDVTEYVKKGILKLDDSEFDNKKPGTYTINLIYGHDSLFPYTESFEVTVTDEKLNEDFIFVSDPNKVSYGIGEELDFTGAYLIIKRNNVSDKIEYYLITDMIEKGLVTVDASEFDNYKQGLYAIYFTYEGKEYSITVAVSSNIPDVNDFILIQKQPEKTVYKIGEELDLTDAKFSGYSNKHGIHGDFFNCNILEYAEKGIIDIDTSEFDNTKAGTYTIYVNYGTATASFEVTVEDTPALPKGDTNGDGNFTIADMVIMQKHIMGKKTAVLSDWKAADLYEDGKINVYDLILMRENIVKKMK